MWCAGPYGLNSELIGQMGAFRVVFVSRAKWRKNVSWVYRSPYSPQCGYHAEIQRNPDTDIECKGHYQRH